VNFILFFAIHSDIRFVRVTLLSYRLQAGARSCKLSGGLVNVPRNRYSRVSFSRRNYFYAVIFWGEVSVRHVELVLGWLVERVGLTVLIEMVVRSI
jgi:hypothetical protein